MINSVAMSGSTSALRPATAAAEASAGRGMALTFIALCVTLVTSVAFARPFDDVIDSGKLTVFVYSDYAPYSWQEGDEYKGIDVDIAREFGRELGVEIELLMRGADENIDDDLRLNVWKGDLIHRRAADVMMHVPYDREVDVRNEFAVLMAPYFEEQMGLVVDADVMPEVPTFARFTSRPIAVELDTVGDFFLSNAFRGQLHNSIRRGRTFASAVDLYKTGATPALMGSLAQAEWVAHVAGRNSYTAQPPMPGIVRRYWPVGIAIKHDSRDLGYALADVLAALVESGRMAEITASYGVEYRPPR